MGFLFGIVVAGAITGLYGLYLQRRRAAWSSAARLRGLRFSHGLLKGDLIQGTVRGLHVKVDTFTTGTGDSKSTWTRVASWGDVPGWLELSPENFGARISKVLGASDVQIGDPDFDRAVLVRGREAPLRALLSAGTRRAVTAALDGARFSIKSGTVKWEQGGVVSKRDVLLGAIDQVVGLSTRLSMTGVDVPQRLIEQVRSDPAAGVRRSCLDQLLRTGDEASIDEALEAAVQDRAPEVRSVAARESIRRSGRCTEDELRTLLRSPDPEDRVLGAGLAATQHMTGFRNALVRLLAQEEVEVRIAAAQALGTIGDVRSVEPLLPLTKGLLANGALKEAARAAVAAIQGRLGAEGGRLALVENRSGRLSVAKKR